MDYAPGAVGTARLAMANPHTTKPAGLASKKDKDDAIQGCACLLATARNQRHPAGKPARVIALIGTIEVFIKLLRLRALFDHCYG